MDSRTADRPYDVKSMGIAIARIAMWFVGFMLLWIAAASTVRIFQDPRLDVALASHAIGSLLLVGAAWGSGWRRLLLPAAAVVLGGLVPISLIANANGLTAGSLCLIIFGGLMVIATFPPLEWLFLFCKQAMGRSMPLPSDASTSATRDFSTSRVRTPNAGRNASLGNSPSLEFRLWTAAEGGKSQEAAFVECTDGIVQVVKRDGTRGRLPLDKLSKQDREYVDRCVQSSEQDLFESI